MNFYYEISDVCVDQFGAKYFAVYDRAGDAVMAGGWRLTQMSDRVWKESPTEVKFVKNRFVDTYDTHGYLSHADKEEFFFVKLKAKPYDMQTR